MIDYNIFNPISSPSTWGFSIEILNAFRPPGRWQAREGYEILRRTRPGFHLPRNLGVCDFIMLDDTGATYLSINSPNGFLALDLAPDDPLMLGYTPLETADGLVVRNFTISFKDANNGNRIFICS